MDKANPPVDKKKCSVTFLPFGSTLKVPKGTHLLEAIKKAHLPLKASCGGKEVCGECLVRITQGSFRCKPSHVLPDRLASQGYTLACQTEITDNLIVELPHFKEQSIQSFVRSPSINKHKISGIYEIDPPVKKIDLQILLPTSDDNSSDLKRLERKLQKELKVSQIRFEYSVIKKTVKAIRQKNGRVTVILFTYQDHTLIIDIFAQDPEKKMYGLACDIGTSTVALHLVDLQSGKILSTSSSLNQQIKCGEDIISRINYAQKIPQRKELHELIIGTVNNLIDKVIRASKIAHSDIYYVFLTGNTTMTHLFLDLDPQYIREEPYVPKLNQVSQALSKTLGLKTNPEARLQLAPAVGSYVGGDITAGLLCTPLFKSPKKISMFIDAGTNGELVIGNRDWLMTCACSAGPAFEGSGIKCGMSASEGAIEKLKIHDLENFEYKTIGEMKPKGLCGSGLVDLLAELFINGYIDRQGKFNKKKVASRIIDSERGKGLLIERSQNSFWEQDLFLTENDISNLIRTKGAIYSACSLLLKNVGLNFDEVDSFYIAGGFGQNLNIENAVRIGLLPDLNRKKFHYLGNTSLLGAYLILISDKNIDLVNKISKKMTYIELNTEPAYMNEYTGALFLPHTDINLFPSIREKLPI